MANHVVVNICGEDYTFVAEESAAYMQKVGAYVSDKMEEVLTQTAAAARSEGAGRIVVGNPINMNGTAGPRSELCQAFADRLRELSGLPVVLWDERSTTVSAIGILNTTDTRGKKRKAVVDAVAATLILESYLAYRKNHPED